MTEIVGTMLLVEEGEPSACESCGEVADLRPYGPGGKNICFACGQRDPEGTLERMCLSRSFNAKCHTRSRPRRRSD